MPELPEVETTRRFVAPVLEGRRLVEAVVRRDRMARRNIRPADVPERLAGRTVTSVGRRGKFIVAPVEGDITMIIHLGMSGRLQIAERGEPEAEHTNVVLRIDTGREVRMVDPRTFGFIAALTPAELSASSLARLGPDALDDLPSGSEMAGRLAGRSAPIKALLLDQRLVSGLGNIYADEVLFRAGVHPRRKGGSLTIDEVTSIRDAIGPVLAEGIAHGGTSLEDLAYLLPDGRAGEYVARLDAYGRSGEPCNACGSPIERVTVAQRSSHFCPRCQPEETTG
jgi:formamidopyrimidine-DNA glycosylase